MNEAKSQDNIRNWREFKLIITDPPSYKGHFEIIKKRLIPFVEKIKVRFWVTNYFDPKRDYILFRVEVNKKELNLTEVFLDELTNQKEIVRYDPPKDWDPKNDAQVRITSASQKLGLPSNIVFKVQGPFVVSHQVALEERVEQLELLFTEAVGSCTKALYRTLKSKPTDPWMMSLFIHLVLNSLDISGPTPPCEESNIRYMPVY